jgi:hypothetical protein
LVSSAVVVASELEVVAVDDAAGMSAGEDKFALSGFPEFVRSGDGFWGDASRGLGGEELTDFGVVGTAAAPRRAASWSPGTPTAVPSDFLAHKSSAVTWGKVPLVA